MPNIITFPRDRIVRIPPAVQSYNDVVIEHARKIERWFREMESAMEGKYEGHGDKPE
jgi:hypothetical protein